jgi:hypothetical protein
MDALTVRHVVGGCGRLSSARLAGGGIKGCAVVDPVV